MSANGLGFTLTDEHKMIQKAARDFAQKEIKPIAAEFDESGDFPSKTIKKMGEMGFMGIEVPEEYGGAAWILCLTSWPWKRFAKRTLPMEPLCP